MAQTPSARSQRILFEPIVPVPGRSLLIRFGVALGLYRCITGMLWVTRAELKEAADGAITFGW